MNRNSRPGARPSGMSIRRRFAEKRKKLTFLAVESLETRQVLSSYALMTNQWPTRTRLTWSIPNDGVYWFKSTNRLTDTFDAEFGQAWRNVIAEAAYAWSSVSDLDLAEVPDGAFAGDHYVSPAAKSPFGDIRIGGYDFANPQILASTFGPPPDGWSRAGDISVNLGVDWSLGSGIDLATVVLHELGHSLGLEHVDDITQAMYPIYQGVRTKLNTGDIAGIQALYGVRRDDAFTLAGIGLSAARPIVVPAPVAGARSSAIAGVELAAAGAMDHFRIDVPANFVGTSLKITASAMGLSMLSPALSLVGADGNVIRTVASPGRWGSEATIDLGPVLAGQSFVFRVTSADANRFAIGGYRLSADFAGGQISTPPAPAPNPPPVVVPPVVVVPPKVTPEPAPVTPPNPTVPVTPPVTTPKPLPRPRPVPKRPVLNKPPVSKPKPIVKRVPTTGAGAGQSALLKALLAKKG